MKIDSGDNTVLLFAYGLPWPESNFKNRYFVQIYIFYTTFEN